MNVKRWIFASALAFAVLFVLENVIHGVLLPISISGQPRSGVLKVRFRA